MSFGTKSDGDDAPAAWANLIEDALGDGKPAQPATFIIFVDGSDFKARDGVDGKIDYSGTNAATVIQAAIDASPSTGFRIYVTEGDYIIDATLDFSGKKNFVFEGASCPWRDYGTRIYLQDAADCTMIKKVEASKDYDSFTFRDLQLYANQENQTSANIDALQFEKVRRFWLDRVRIFYAKRDGIRTSNVDVFWITNCEVLGCVGNGIGMMDFTADGFIRGCSVGNCTGDGIHLEGASSGDTTILASSIYGSGDDGIKVVETPGTNILGCRVWTAGDGGIVLRDGVKYSRIIGNQCYRNTNDGIILYDSGTGCTYNVIEGNSCYYTAGDYAQKYGIRLQNNSDYNIIKGNLTYNNATAPYSMVGDHNVYDGKSRSATSVDLSGAAETLVILHAEEALHLARATLLYTEASSADAGVTVKIGKETDDDYYYTGTSEVSKAQWYTNIVTLLKNDIAAGDTLTFTSAGGKTGTGEIMLIADFLAGA